MRYKSLKGKIIKIKIKTWKIKKKKISLKIEIKNEILTFIIMLQDNQIWSVGDA